MIDQDGDRLFDCQEVARGLSWLNPDTDGDGLGDGDEVLGTVAGLNLPAMGVNPRRKDILIEYDWFDENQEAGTGTCSAVGNHSHRPTQAMLDIVTVMYGAAPISNPNGVSGINIIHDMGQGGQFTGGNLAAHPTGIISGNVFDADFNSVYAANFASNRQGYFHYVLMAHRYTGGPSGSSGIAEFSASDGFVDEIIVSLYCLASTTNVAYTIAHELGHNLELQHGGDTSCNRKPNYNSIMNYRFQFQGVDNTCDASGDFIADFSRGARANLNENALNEFQGVCGSPSIDWNGNSVVEANVAEDINIYTGQSLECPGGGSLQVLTDYNDWGNLRLPIPQPGGGGGGTPDYAVACGPPY